MSACVTPVIVTASTPSSWSAQAAAYKSLLSGGQVCASVCLFICLPVCLCICVSVYPFACLPVCLSVFICVPVCLSVCPSVCLSACLPTCLSLCLSALRAVCLFVTSSVCLTACLCPAPVFTLLLKLVILCDYITCSTAALCVHSQLCCQVRPSGSLTIFLIVSSLHCSHST